LNNREKEVLQTSLNAEKSVLNALEKNYKSYLEDVKLNIKLLQGDEQSQSKIYQRQYQESLEKEIQGYIDKLQNNNYANVSDYLKDCYTNGYTGSMYSLQGQGVPITTPIDQRQMLKAVSKTGNDIKLSKKLYESVGKLKNQTVQELTRGVATNLHYNDIARNIANRGNVSMNNAMRIARTEGHRIQCEAQNTALHTAKDRGADVVKQWDAALDARTRTTHQYLDGQIKEIDEEFESGRHKALYPGNFGVPAEDINCRCSLNQRARWALGDDELKELQERAEYYGLDKTKDFEDYKQKYLQLPPENSKIKLTTDEEKAVNDYVGAKSYTLNEKLRTGAELTPAEKKLMDNLDSALSKMPTYQGTVYRSITDMGIGDVDDFINEHEIGAVVKYPSYTSTSTSVYDDTFPIQYVIKSKSGSNIQAYNKKEQEILFKRGSQFFVEKVDGKTIYLREA
jgi:SPP1 gp7 family putative phage head morphogenesis protein